MNELEEVNASAREPKLPFASLSLLRMNLRGGRTSAALEHLWNLAELTTEIKDKNK